MQRSQTRQLRADIQFLTQEMADQIHEQVWVIENTIRIATALSSRLDTALTRIEFLEREVAQLKTKTAGLSRIGSGW